MASLDLIGRAESHGDAVALRSGGGRFTYSDLLTQSEMLAAELLGDGEDLREARVAHLAPAGADYVTSQWGIWRAGGVTVPLSLSATEAELEYTLVDSDSFCVVATPELRDKVHSLCDRLNLRLLIQKDTDEGARRSLPAVGPARRAMMLYTSGTTSKPKGVVSTHANIQAQIETLVEAWQWDRSDCIPLFLPLHHIHGIINVLSCALWVGAMIEPFPRFDVNSILQRVAAGAFSVFMAVPTIYVKLIQTLEAMSDAERASVVDGFRRMRLMISGSAALPASVHEQWFSMTGQKLLERYGMTEIGMALSNPYEGERRAGTVGHPLPGVEIRLKAEQGSLVTAENEPGEIQVRGPGVFLEYWNRPQATADSYDDDWFQTGDVAVIEDDYYRIMGRLSVDIIKSGGYKLSALEIEAVLLQHPEIRECAVVGVPDETWGEAVAAAVVTDQRQQLSLDSLRSWCRDHLSHYKIPKRLQVVDQLPRNAMGKVTKPAVRELF